MTTYVYGIGRTGLTLPDTPGVGGAALRTVALDGVAAVVSDAGDGPLRATAAGLKAHTRVLDELAARDTVLPLQFGTLLPDDAAVADVVLAPNVERLHELLLRLEGQVQLTLKVFNNEESALREVVASDARVHRLWQKVRGVPADAAYYDRIQLGQEIARALRDRQAATGPQLFEALAPLCVDAQAKDPSQDLMVLDADFLVSRSAVDEFDAQVDALAQARPELEFRYLGPMPAYSFTDLVLEGA